MLGVSLDRSTQKNYPVGDNQAVQVRVVGKLPNNISIGPNPMTPTPRHPETELINYGENAREVTSWAYYEGAV